MSGSLNGRNAIIYGGGVEVAAFDAPDEQAVNDHVTDVVDRSAAWTSRSTSARVRRGRLTLPRPRRSSRRTAPPD